MDKKGQIFLIAAVVIIGLIVTLAVVNISTKTSGEEKTIYDLSKETKYESTKLIDSGIFNPSGGDINEKIKSLISSYSALNPDTDFTFVYGNENSAQSITYTAINTGEVGLPGTSYQTSERETITNTATSESGIIRVTFADKTTKEFVLNPGENFYIILEKTKSGETYVAK